MERKGGGGGGEESVDWAWLRSSQSGVITLASLPGLFRQKKMRDYYSKRIEILLNRFCMRFE